MNINNSAEMRGVLRGKVNRYLCLFLVIMRAVVIRRLDLEI